MTRLPSFPLCLLAAAFLAGCATIMREPAAPAAPGTGEAGRATAPAAGGKVTARRLPEAQAPRPTSPAAGGVGLAHTSAHVPGPFIALTFDDGPHLEHTPRLLDILGRKGVHATFFVLGSRCGSAGALLRRMVAEGHEIANHSWSHPQFTRLSNEAVRGQIARTHEAVRAATGVSMRALRPPYGSTNGRLNRLIIDEFRCRVVLWSVDPLDWRDRSATLVAERILRATNSGAIILVHDIHASSVDAMPAAIDGLLAKGYRFVTVSELLDMERSITLEPAPSRPDGARS